jgi:hypothetical protein
MNAKEAKATATKRAAELKTQREEAARKRDEAAADKWRRERAAWFEHELESIEEDIAEAVHKGKTKIDVWLATTEKPEQAEEKVFWTYFAYKPELKKVIKHFEQLGYELNFRVKKEEHYDLSDLNPRDNWFTYETILEVSWQ